MTKKAITIILLLISFIGFSQNIHPNRLVSKNKPVYSSSGRADFLVDGDFKNPAWEISEGSWVSIKIGSPKEKIMLSWNSPNYSWSDVIASNGSCKDNLQTLESYQIQVSSNSGDGDNGDWTTVVTIEKNAVNARAHQFDFIDQKWVRLNIIKGGGSLDEIEVFDMSEGNENVWFFVGTSISANTFKATPPYQTFADHINIGHTSHDPVMIRGGIPCISSGHFANDMTAYLEASNGAKYWAIEMGTNDAWGGSSGNATAFKNNLQTVITTCKNEGIKPIIARILSTNETNAEWQVNPAFLTAIDELVIENELIEGPDLYTWFLDHPQHLSSDGVHPNASGAANIQRLWAEKLAPLFGVADSLPRSPEVLDEKILDIESSIGSDRIQMYPNPIDGSQLNFILNNRFIGTSLSITDINGKKINKKIKIEQTSFSIGLNASSGIYFVHMHDQNGNPLIKKLIVK